MGTTAASTSDITSWNSFCVILQYIGPCWNFFKGQKYSRIYSGEVYTLTDSYQKLDCPQKVSHGKIFMQKKIRQYNNTIIKSFKYQCKYSEWNPCAEPKQRQCLCCGWADCGKCVIGFKLRSPRLNQQVLFCLIGLAEIEIIVWRRHDSLLHYYGSGIFRHGFDLTPQHLHNKCKIAGTYLRPMVTCSKKLRVEIQCSEQHIHELAQILHFCGSDSVVIISKLVQCVNLSKNMLALTQHWLYVIFLYIHMTTAWPHMNSTWISIFTERDSCQNSSHGPKFTGSAVFTTDMFHLLVLGALDILFCSLSATQLDVMSDVPHTVCFYGQFCRERKLAYHINCKTTS